MPKSNKLVIIGIILVIVFFIFIFLYSPLTKIVTPANGSGIIAYVNIYEIYSSHPEKEVAERKLENKTREIEAELIEKIEDVPEAEQQEVIESYQQELSSKEQQLIGDILVKIDEAIKEIASKKEDIRLVLSEEKVAYGGYDLTEEVINYIKNSY